MPAAGTPPIAPYVAIGAVGAALLLVALMLARASARARRRRASAPARRARKRSFDAGRAWGASTRVAALDDALALLRSGKLPTGTLVSADARSDGSVVRVAVRRKRSEPCDVVAGSLVGLFECAWASDAALAPHACAGKMRGAVCAYEISRRAAPAGGGASARSGSALHPWPPARSGGG